MERLRNARLLVVCTVLAATSLAASTLAGCEGGGSGPPGGARAPAGASQEALPSTFAGLVAEDLMAGDRVSRARTLREIQSTGARLIRQTFDWAGIERRPGRFRFGPYDSYMAALAARRFRVLPILFNPPSFRSSAPRTGRQRGTYPPRRPADMGAFAAVLVRRYGPRGSFWTKRPDLPQYPITSWQVWNEPNLARYWPSGPNAREYVRLLSAVNDAIKDVDPQAETVSAGIPDTAAGIPLQSYLAAMYRAGAKSAFDTLAVHPYARDSTGVLNAVKAVRGLLTRFRDRKPIWVTELGWASDGPPSEFTVGEEGQAARLAGTIDDLARLRGQLGIRGFVYFNWRDSTPYRGGKDFWGLHTGLLRIDGARKPAFEAYEQSVKGAR